ncbi:MAG TPA: rod shape-determining protein MreC [Actinomycetes bacterium]|nr:rod shape-determining protein MreC [Actinomycetes bacterium]
MRDDRRTRVVLGLLLLASFTLITLDLRGGSALPSGLRNGISGVVGPVQNATVTITRPVGDFFHRMTHDDSATIDRLTRENQALQRQLLTTQDAQRRAAELDAMLKVSSLGQYTLIPARVIAVGAAQGFDFTVEIDAGTKDGITPDMTVLNGQGLVGRVKYVTRDTATVVLLIDPDSGVGVRLEGTGQIGLLSGQGKRPMQLVVQNSGHVLRVGERLVTLGSVNDKPYVPGVPVGQITAVTSVVGSADQVASVEPFVDVTSLDLVGVVVKPPPRDPRDAVLAALPSPSPSASPSASASPSTSSSPSVSQSGSRPSSSGSRS